MGLVLWYEGVIFFGLLGDGLCDIVVLVIIVSIILIIDYVVKYIISFSLVVWRR